MPVIITTNLHRCDILDGYNLTQAERDEFDYIDWPAVEDGNDSVSMVRYRGKIYDLNDVDGEASQETFPGWDTYRTDSYSSGMVFRYLEDPDSHGDWYVIVGSYYVKSDTSTEALDTPVS